MACFVVETSFSIEICSMIRFLLSYLTLVDRLLRDSKSPQCGSPSQRVLAILRKAAWPVFESLDLGLNLALALTGSKREIT